MMVGPWGGNNLTVTFASPDGPEVEEKAFLQEDSPDPLAEANGAVTKAMDSNKNENESSFCRKSLLFSGRFDMYCFV
jgi:hypothetical protein